jgi:hypothetical protein
VVEAGRRHTGRLAMPSHFSTLGFDDEEFDSIDAWVNHVAELAEVIPVDPGQYLRWVGGSGEELWLYLDNAGDVVDLVPHFTGRSSVPLRSGERVHRDDDSPMDGAFVAWAGTNDERSGEYPFVFDVPDAATYVDMEVPWAKAEAQIAAFAHDIEVFQSPEAFYSDQEEGPKMASQSFIPSGMFEPDGGETRPPKAEAMFAGHVVASATKRNAITGKPFHWALVESLYAKFDVVVDPGLLAEAPDVGSVLSGGFWLSGRLTSYPKKERSRLGGFLGR